MGELRSGLFFFALSLFVLWESLRVGLGTSQKPGSGFISFCTGLMLAALSLALAYQGRRSQKFVERHPRPVILALVSLFVYSFVIDYLGFIMATFFLLVVFFRLGEQRPWPTLLGMSALTTLLVYLVFGVLLQIYFPQGLLSK